jgi:hypothetical protein
LSLAGLSKTGLSNAGAYPSEAPFCFCTLELAPGFTHEAGKACQEQTFYIIGLIRELILFFMIKNKNFF